MKEFYEAWIYMPFLMISIVFGALAGLLGGVFSAVKDSKTLGITTMIGALTNIVLNILLISKIGVIGAAIATAISYLLVWIIRIFTVKKYIKLNLNLKKDICVYLILLLQCLSFFLIKNIFILYLFEFISFIFVIILYKNILLKLLQKISKIIMKGKKYNESRNSDLV